MHANRIRTLGVLVVPLVAASYGSAQCAEWDPRFHAGFDGTIRAMAVFDDGSGPSLYAGGEFQTAGSVSASNIAKWDGSSWSPLGAPGSGTSTRVEALTVFDDGSGPALYVGGYFTSVDGVPMSRVAMWDGSSWTPLGSGTSGAVRALLSFDDGSGPALYAGGEFTTAGGVSAPASPSGTA